VTAGISLETVVESVSRGCRIDAKGTTAWIGAETMPIHDWTRVEAGLFHAFHQHWIIFLCDALNAGGLPPEYFALPEQPIRGPIPDVLTLRLAVQGGESSEHRAGVAVAAVPPPVRHILRTEENLCARKADRVTVRHKRGEIVAVIEIVSPGNKGSRNALRSFVAKSTRLIEQGVHLLVIDLFPPSERDPQGIHPALWSDFEEDEDEEFTLPADKPLTLASYDAGPPPTAYIEPVGVGDAMPEMPLFLEPEFYVPAPLEATYQISWSHFPAALKRLLDAPRDDP
jgi:hypothetical protein